MSNKPIPVIAALLGALASQAVAGTVAINAGGPAAPPFAADGGFSGGSTTSNWTGVVDTSLVSSPAPQAVYQTERYGSFSYVIGGFSAGVPYTVNLHFTEDWDTAAGQRLENVSINGTQVLTNFDIFLAAGARHKAIVRTFTPKADANGNISFSFAPTSTSPDRSAKVDGIEIIGATDSSSGPASAQIGWASINADKCDGTNFSTGGAVSGSIALVPPINTTTYSIKCTSKYGSGTTSVIFTR